jgi:small subunit ribosomal protein S21
LIEVTVREHETLDQALKRFRRKIRKEGLMEQIRSQMQYEKPSAKRRRKARLAARRADQRELEKPPRTSTVRLVPDWEWEEAHQN